MIIDSLLPASQLRLTRSIETDYTLDLFAIIMKKLLKASVSQHDYNSYSLTVVL